MSDERIFGIDLGTTNSAIGLVDAGFPFLYADSEGRRIQPSAVAFDADGEVHCVGAAAARMRGVQPGRVVRSVKSLIGRRLSEVAEQDVRLEGDSEGRAGLRLGSKLWSPEAVSAEILKSLVSIASEREGSDVRRVVITVPAYFNEAQRAATKEAGELAGLQVERILNEPTAAALAFGIDRDKSRTKVAVFDLGGGTFDLTVLQLDEGVFEVLSTRGDTDLGGDDIDRLLALAALEDAGLDWGALDRGEQVRLLEACEASKRQITPEKGFCLNLPFLTGERNLNFELSPGALRSLLGPLLERIERHCKQAVLDSGCTVDDLDRVLLVGGSSRLFAVRELAREIFGREPDLSQDPDETIGLGAAIQGAVLSGALRDIVLLDVTPLSLGLETLGGLMNVLIPRNTTIPCKAGEMFTNAVDGQSSMRVRILQGEREMARDNWELGRLEVPFSAAAKGNARVGVQFSIDANGLLEVLARDVEAGRDRVLRIDHAAVDVADEKVEQMVSESVEYAFDDMNERVFTEAKMKAEELLPAVRAALEQLAEQLDADEKNEIEEAAAAVERALESGAAATLKQKVGELDKWTEALAAAVVEKAMEEALERRIT